MPSRPLRHDPLPSLASEVLALYAGPLAEVRFPDLDLASLRALALEVEEAQRALEQVEDALEAARAEVAARAEALSARAQRALAYARVFADGDSELSARVAALSETRLAEGSDSASRKRGRPKKTDTDRNSLFGGLAPEAEARELAI